MVLLICRRLSLFGNSRPGLRWVGSMRPLVKLDAQVEDDVDQRGVKPKNHRGIFNRGVSRLPEKLLNAISKTIESMSNKSLLQESKKLNNHLIFKKPPLSADDIDAIKRSIEMEIHGDSSLDGCSFLLLFSFFIFIQICFKFFFRSQPFQFQRSEKVNRFPEV